MPAGCLPETGSDRGGERLAGRFWEILPILLVESQAFGTLVSDAALAALALEHGAVLCTTDRDFTRFPGVRTVSPLEG